MTPIRAPAPTPKVVAFHQRDGDPLTLRAARGFQQIGSQHLRICELIGDDNLTSQCEVDGPMIKRLVKFLGEPLVVANRPQTDDGQDEQPTRREIHERASPREKARMKVTCRRGAIV